MQANDVWHLQDTFKSFSSRKNCQN